MLALHQYMIRKKVALVSAAALESLSSGNITERKIVSGTFENNFTDRFFF